MHCSAWPLHDSTSFASSGRAAPALSCHLSPLVAGSADGLSSLAALKNISLTEQSSYMAPSTYTLAKLEEQPLVGEGGGAALLEYDGPAVAQWEVLSWVAPAFAGLAWEEDDRL